MKKISVIVPCYNEEENIVQIVSAVKNELEKSQSEFQEAANIRKENAKEAAKKGVEKSEEEFYIWQKNQEKNQKPDDDNDENEQEESEDTNIIDTIKNKLGEIFKF